ncbi:hypothetical protein [Cupriavidus metallidurans]|uniref:hypothetical protein n=1 Tax=Cupriavidus metallidurans TaxID=119219 RepID=UPI00158CD4B0|nr:hypothetical protein [Cupriavidus metallidurans]
MAFSDAVKAGLLALDAGDSVAVSGSLAMGVWTPDGGAPRAQAKMVANLLMTAYAVNRKRHAVLAQPNGGTPAKARRFDGTENARQAYGGGRPADRLEDQEF